MTSCALDRAKCKREITRELTRDLFRKLMNQLERTEPNAGELAELLSQLALKEPILQELDDQIEEATEIDSLMEEVREAQKFKEEITTWKTRANKASERVQQRGGRHNQTETREQRNSSIGVKLPRLNLEKFYGDACSWSSFWNQFEVAIDKNSSLTGTDKFHYLRSYLGGVAANAVNGLALTEENYLSAIQVLKDRFGRKDIVVNSHMNKLLSLQSVKKSSDVVALRRLYDSCEIQIRSLESVGIVSGSYSSLLCPVLMRLVPDDITLEYSRRRKSDSDWDVLEFLEFLRFEVESRERAFLLSKPGRDQQEQIAGSRKNSHDNRNRNYSCAKPPSAAALNATIEDGCVFCGKAHRAGDCQELTVSERKEKLKKGGRCFVCLTKGHLARNCKNRTNLCPSCGRRHHRSICESNDPGHESKPPKTPTENAVINYQGHGSNAVMLQTIRAQVPGENSTETVRCILDGGSQRTFVREDLSRRLRLPVLGDESLKIHTFGSDQPFETTRKRVKLTLRNPSDINCFIELEALETPSISSAAIVLPDREIAARLHAKGIELSDRGIDNHVVPDEIPILIGSDLYWKIVTGRMERVGEAVVAMETLFGWTLQGPVPLSCLSADVSSLYIHEVLTEEGDSLSDRLRSFWEIEHLGIAENECTELKDDEAMRHFEATIHKTNGRYQVSLPWKVNHPELQDNQDLARRRLRGLKRRFDRDSSYYQRYQEIITEQHDQGVIEAVCTSTGTPGTTYYLPHHGILREEKETSKLRIVYDASSHEKGCASLNDCLHAGPNLNPNLLGILLTFRLHYVAVTADIERAFLQVLLAESDRDACRFFWFKESPLGNPDPELQVFRFTRVPFGATSSPFLLAGTIRHHLKTYEGSEPELCETLRECLYVDDFISGAEDKDKARKLKLDATGVLAEAGMHLRKWKSNCPELRDENGTDHADGQNAIFKNDYAASQQKVLGLTWNATRDTFTFDMSSLLAFLMNQDNTKRVVLQTTARIFDPVGFLSPITIRPRCLFQEIWKRGLSWDRELPDDLKNEWTTWCSELRHLDEIEIPRHYFSAHTTKPMEMELHAFSDASPKAYGAAIYMRFVGSDNGIGSVFVCSKSRVAPLKTLSLPRLELMGAVIASRLLKFTKSALKHSGPVYLWTDSTITLQWIRGNATSWKPFVCNRVREIQTITEPELWFHCPGHENPADLLTRGIPCGMLNSRALWWTGPEWLRQPSNNWPTCDTSHFGEDSGETDGSHVIVEFLEVRGDSPRVFLEPLLQIQKYSSLRRVLRITAWIIRICHNMKTPQKRSGPLSIDELREAELYWIAFTQCECFGREIQALMGQHPIKNDSQLRDLNPVLDGQKLLCARTRLQESDLTPKEKEPWILPYGHKFSELAAMDCHEQIMHSGVSETLSQLRETYWIIKGRRLVKTVLSKCLICKRLKNKPIRQPAAPLPRDRIIESPPFETTGVDFCGPLYVKSEGEVKKAYIALFTCAVTRAIHLELVQDLTAHCFLLAFRRFVSRRGFCKVLFSDNAKTFKRANQDLKYLWTGKNKSEIYDHFGRVGVKWKFIVERAAWWGGFWERLVRSTKSCLKKTLGKTSLTYDELTATLSEVEAVLNSRPITYQYTGSNEPSPLTPSHFIVGHRLTALPSGKTGPNVSPTSTIGRTELTKRSKYRELILQQFWTRWRREYLTDLRSANMSPATGSSDLRKDDVVLIQQDKIPRHVWPMGRVTELFPGRDGRVRSCLIKTTTGTVIRRPVQLLFPLEIT